MSDTKVHNQTLTDLADAIELLKTKIAPKVCGTTEFAWNKYYNAKNYLEKRYKAEAEFYFSPDTITDSPEEESSITEVA